jgi:hypothetical protein
MSPLDDEAYTSSRGDMPEMNDGNFNILRGDVPGSIKRHKKDIKKA